MTNIYNDNIKKSLEKFKLFIELTKNYNKKQKNLLSLFKKSDIIKNQTNSAAEAKEIIINELSKTIDNFYSTIHNPKLIENLLNLNTKIDTTDKFLEEFNQKEEEIRIKNSNLIEIIEKLEIKIKRLQEQNENLDLKNKNEVYNNILISIKDYSTR